MNLLRQFFISILFFFFFSIEEIYWIDMENSGDTRRGCKVLFMRGIYFFFSRKRFGHHLKIQVEVILFFSDIFFLFFLFFLILFGVSLSVCWSFICCVQDIRMMCPFPLCGGSIHPCAIYIKRKPL